MLPENTDEYCSSPCISETHLVLNCIENVLSHFKFYNKASINDVRETIKSGCSYGPKRGILNSWIFPNSLSFNCVMPQKTKCIAYLFIWYLYVFRRQFQCCRAHSSRIQRCRSQELEILPSFSSRDFAVGFSFGMPYLLTDEWINVLGHVFIVLMVYFRQGPYSFLGFLRCFYFE